MVFTEVKRHTLVGDVSDQLARSIRDGLATDGGLLPSERNLAEQFGVSRPVIREATKRLELQGLVEIRQGVGIRVVDRLYAPMSAAARLLVPDQAGLLRKSLEVRAALEPEVAKLAAERATDSDRQQLLAIHAKFEATTDLEDATELDLAFHSELARISGNEIFGLMLDSIADLGRASRRETMSRAGIERAIQQHGRILRAIESGNPVSAARAMRAHIQSAVEDLLNGRAK